MRELYHYCSIETLECILEYKTIRFSSLEVVDDMEEAMTADFDQLGRVCFVSCWTDKEDEDVTMWRTYTEDKGGKKSGVRLRLPCNLFDNTSNRTITQLEEEFDIELSPTERGVTQKEPIVFPVTYTKDETLIELEVHSVKKNQCDGCNSESMESNINTIFLGKFKRDVWAGQAEWRYRIIAVPKEYYRNKEAGRYNNSDLSLEERMTLMDQDLKTIPFRETYIDFPFNPSILKELEITSSPLNSETDNEEIKRILSNHGLNIKLNSSSLRIRNRAGL